MCAKDSRLVFFTLSFSIHSMFKSKPLGWDRRRRSNFFRSILGNRKKIERESKNFMAPKRKMEITVVDENDRGLFSIFQNVANNLCQLYAQGSANQKLAFEAGQHYSYVEMHEWIAAKLLEGKQLTVADILGYMQDKMNGPTMGHAEQWGCGTDQNGASASHAELTTPSSSAQQGISYPDVHKEMNMDVNMD